MNKTRIFIISIAFFFLPGMALATLSKPIDSGDSIPVIIRDTFAADIRQPNYHYTKWFDECSNYFPNGGVVDSCFCRFPEIHNFYGSPIAKWEYTNHRLRLKGLVAMVDRYTPPTDDNGNVAVLDGNGNVIGSVTIKLPEYLYLYQLVGRHPVGSVNKLDFALVDSVRWDTATARVMELKRGWKGEYNQYCYMYEANFENPVYVDTDFYIFGSTNSNPIVSNNYIHTTYTDIMDFNGYALKDGCDENNYFNYITDECHPQGGWVGVYQSLGGLGWYTPWPDSPWGYYLAIVDEWNLDALPDTTSHGNVTGGGRWPDESYDTIEAIAAPGYYFYAWNDGVIDNPRVIHLTSDTSFIAIFNAMEEFDITVNSSDETQGTVTGGGTYDGGTDVTIAALPNNEHKFMRWNDGNVDNPRVVHLMSDTSFTAYFAVKDFYMVQTASNNGEWGTVDGGGVYMEGEDATLTVSTAPFCLFEGWSDGDWSLPRVVTVTRDTLFTALFSFDSAWAAGIETAGDLDFTVLPNPTTGHLTVRMGRPGDCEVVLLDMRGRELLRVSSTETSVDLDLSLLPSGQYLLIVTTRGKNGIRKVVKK